MSGTGTENKNWWNNKHGVISISKGNGGLWDN